MAKTYLFIERNEANPTGEEIAKVVFDGKTSVWSGDPSCKELVVGEKFNLTDGIPFDDTNPDHMDMLPLIVSGDYLWVSEE